MATLGKELLSREQMNNSLQLPILRPVCKRLAKYTCLHGPRKCTKEESRQNKNVG